MNLDNKGKNIKIDMGNIWKVSVIWLQMPVGELHGTTDSIFMSTEKAIFPCKANLSY